MRSDDAHARARGAFVTGSFRLFVYEF